MAAQMKSVKAAKAEARRRLRALEADRESTINRAVEAFAREDSAEQQYRQRLESLEAEYAARRGHLQAETAGAAKAVVDLLGAATAAQVLGVKAAELRKRAKDAAPVEQSA